jgi:CheY-like chemotaxis protein
MSKTGIILVIEDDKDDQELIESVIRKLEYKNSIKFFDECTEAYNFLCNSNEPIFIIFSDINLPIQDGLSLKREIDTTPVLRKKSIPFIFYSTAAHPSQVKEAFTEMTVQGFFKKSNDYNKMFADIKLILEYWSTCVHPNTQI